MIANLKFLIVFFHIVGHEWDAIHLYIANNIDWMEEWIERCIEFYGTLSWEGVQCIAIEKNILINLHKGKLI